MSKPQRQCIDCAREGITSKRKTPHPGPRCATHWRQVRNARRSRTHEKWILETYGLTLAEYDAIHARQGGKCFICQRATGERKRLSVDHDHQTGYTRGLLCLRCNRNILGHARDDIAFFERCIEYLRNPPAQQIIGKRVAPIHQIGRASCRERV